MAPEPRGTRLAVGTAHGRILIFQPEDRKVHSEDVVLHNAIQQIAWVNDDLLAIAGVGFRPALLNLKTKQIRWLFGHTKNAEAIDTVPGGMYILTGGDDETIRVWQVSDAQQISNFNPWCGFIRALKVLPDGKKVLCTGSDGTVRLWEFPLPK